MKLQNSLNVSERHISHFLKRHISICFYCEIFFGFQVYVLSFDIQLFAVYFYAAVKFVYKFNAFMPRISFSFGPFLPSAKTGLSAVPLSLHTLLRKVRLRRCCNPLSMLERRVDIIAFKRLRILHLFQITAVTPADSASFYWFTVSVFCICLNFNFYPV